VISAQDESIMIRADVVMVPPAVNILRRLSAPPCIDNALHAEQVSKQEKKCYGSHNKQKDVECGSFSRHVFLLVLVFHV
jgi:hypothetical protein